MGEPDASPARPAASASMLTKGAGGPRAHLPRYWLLSRLLATAGALLIVVSTWIPWVSARVFDATGTAYLSRPLLLDPGEIDSGSFLDISWSYLVPLVLLLIPLLWLRPRPGWRVQPAALIYCWVVLVLVIHTWALSAILLQPDGFYLAPELGSTRIETGQLQVLPGAWLAGIGAAVAVLAALMLVVGFFRSPLVPPPNAEAIASSARTPGRRRPAIGALVFAVLFFWLGTLILPWSTVNCTATPLFFGQCTGLPFSGVLSDAIRADVPSLDPLAAIYGVNVLLSGGALLTLLAVFFGARSRYIAFWTMVWLLVATGFVALASVGVRLVASSPANFDLPHGVWSGDIGIFVTLLALALGWLGVGALWLGRQRAAPA